MLVPSGASEPCSQGVALLTSRRLIWKRLRTTPGDDEVPPPLGLEPEPELESQAAHAELESTPPSERVMATQSSEPAAVAPTEHGPPPRAAHPAEGERVVLEVVKCDGLGRDQAAADKSKLVSGCMAGPETSADMCGHALPTTGVCLCYACPCHKI